ncbi:hypothetical protein [Paraburkholderia sp. C35]|uniref:hypothetical protein n=1 Tax=Paraburkholderia sp. C35 TaxID=2126993 RepID=UPI000D68ABE4|nr:hypothetical protein [Paraburkholderia sp. C35]
MANRRWETVPEQYQDQAYRNWRDRYRTTNVAMSPLDAAPDVQDGFPVGESGERLSGFFDSSFVVEKLRDVHANSGMNERGVAGEVRAGLQRAWDERQRSLQGTMNLASGPDHWRLTLLRDAEKSSFEEQLARLSNAPNAAALGEVAKDRFADLQAHDYAYNHPIANPDRDLIAVPPTKQEAFNWLKGRDTVEHGDRVAPQRSIYETTEDHILGFLDHSSDKGVAVRQIDPLPRPANDVDISIRETIRIDAEKAEQALKDAQKQAAQHSNDRAPQFVEQPFEREEFKPEPDFREKAGPDGDRFYRGTLAEIGTRLMRDDDPSSRTPFARIEGRHGEQHIVNGVDVPKAIARAGLAVGETIELRKTDSHSVGEKNDPATGEKVDQVRNGWDAKAHDFAEHDQWQRDVHDERQEERLEQHDNLERARFAAFKVEAEAWKQRNPSETQTIDGFANMLDAPSTPRQDAQGERVARASTRAQRKLDALLGRTPAEPVQEPVQAQAPAQSPVEPAADNRIVAEVERVRAERDQRLGLGQPGGMPAQHDGHVQALTQHKSDQHVLAETLDAAGTSMRTGFTSDQKGVYFDFKVNGEAVNGHASWDPDALEMGKQQQPNAIDAFTAPTGRLEQALGHPVTEDTRGFVKDALHAYVERSAIDTIQRDGYVVGIPHLPSRDGLAAKLDSRAHANAPEVQQDDGEGQRQGGAGSVQHAAPVVEKPVQAPVPSLGALAERVDARQPEQPAHAPAVTQEPVSPTVDVEAPAVASATQAPQEPAPARPNLPNLGALAERVDARQPEPAVQAPVEQPKVEQTPSVTATVASAEPVKAEPSVETSPNQKPANLPNLGALASRLSADVKQFNAEVAPTLQRTTASIEHLSTTSRAQEQSFAQEQLALKNAQRKGIGQSHTIPR